MFVVISWSKSTVFTVVTFSNTFAQSQSMRYVKSMTNEWMKFEMKYCFKIRADQENQLPAFVVEHATT